jgi:methylenetetrahydrofolate--tRNA-(uracil-5-)-methyltransferase
MLGALLSHITGGADAKTFQPMNINYGLLPELGFKHSKKERKALYGKRALTDIATWLENVKPQKTKSAA